MRVSGLPGDAEAVGKPGLRLCLTTCLQQQLGGHLVGRNVLWRLGEDDFVLGQGLIVVSVSGIGDRQAVAGEGICRMCLQNLRKRGDFVHGPKMTEEAAAVQGGRQNLFIPPEPQPYT